jgi:hypothetical protein
MTNTSAIAENVEMGIRYNAELSSGPVEVVADDDIELGQMSVPADWHRLGERERRNAAGRSETSFAPGASIYGTRDCVSASAKPP